MYAKAPEALSIAGGAIAAGLLDVLVERGISTTDDARKVLQSASISIGAHARTPAGYEAVGIITSLLNGPYAAGG